MVTIFEVATVIIGVMISLYMVDMKCFKTIWLIVACSEFLSGLYLLVLWLCRMLRLSLAPSSYLSITFLIAKRCGF